MACNHGCCPLTKYLFHVVLKQLQGFLFAKSANRGLEEATGRQRTSTMTSPRDRELAEV